MGARDGLVHISEIKNERVAKVSEVLTEGQEVKVKVLGIDDRGKVRLSMRLVDQETGEELPDTRPPREEREPRGDRGDRGDRGGRGGSGGGGRDGDRRRDRGDRDRSEEHTSELQSLMRISYAVFCLKKKNSHERNNEIE